MATVAILAASGYSGQETLDRVLRHPELEVVALGSDSLEGESASALDVRLNGSLPPFVANEQALAAGADLVFACLGNDRAALLEPPAGAVVVDLSGAHRLQDALLYPAWYGFEHPLPGALADWSYAVPELYPPQGALIANPGCYATAAILALEPLRGAIDESSVVIDAKSGVSGAGHNVDDAYLFGTIDESVRPYGVPKHRHTPEIAQEVRGMSGRATRLTFTPHLIPMNRGLIATCYATLRGGVDAARVADAYATAYAEEPFVRVTTSYPATKATLGSNWCLVHAVVDEANHRLVAFAAIDNLVKGAAGSAIQNLNAMRGYPETMGLEALPLWP